MGCRASIASIKGGILSIAYAHSSADQICSQLSEGDLPEGYDRDEGGKQGFLDDVFAEGGLLVDEDRKVMLYFGHSDLVDFDVSYADRISARWPGYVTVMVDQIHEIVRYAAQRGLATERDYLISHRVYQWENGGALPQRLELLF